MVLDVGLGYFPSHVQVLSIDCASHCAAPGHRLLMLLNIPVAVSGNCLSGLYKPSVTQFFGVVTYSHHRFREPNLTIGYYLRRPVECCHSYHRVRVRCNESTLDRVSCSCDP